MGCSPDGAACGAIRVLLPNSPGLSLAKRLHPGYDLYWCIFMRTIKFTSWQDSDFFIGFLNDYPYYLTQGMSREELADNLKSLLIDLESDEIPYLRKVEELLVA